MSARLSYRSYNDLIGTLKCASDKIKGRFDMVLGVPRSGMVPAYLLALQHHLPVMDLETFISGGRPSGGARSGKFSTKKVARILVVDDSIHFGAEMTKVRKKLGAFSGYDFTFMAVYGTEESRGWVDICLESIPAPRVFEWNIMYSWIYGYSCVDIDGVLCYDPTDEENDDGEKYRRFILNARPKFIPQVKINSLVTARLEKYRKETEDWLQRQGIQYDNLYMLDLPDKETRVKLGNHGHFKASVYSSLKNAMLFIESDKKQAERIRNITNRPVFCADTFEYFAPVDHKQTLLHRGVRKAKRIFGNVNLKTSAW